ncbi:uncharacterized protein LOC106152100 [Lingula anatina]|uniref:Uncharacterized protein LOC106152100 n=1 Tax=Lingula anatina TaxID=7574 RepID=A0A1S3H4W5_LINAN|nr:uncharacterized protein LOC106152100 [Lingula anatina]|eukprot:XP_013381048.1 uncharacterized protein LOC106152100 [Lingula anatina]
MLSALLRSFVTCIMAIVAMMCNFVICSLAFLLMTASRNEAFGNQCGGSMSGNCYVDPQNCEGCDNKEAIGNSYVCCPGCAEKPKVTTTTFQFFHMQYSFNTCQCPALTNEVQGNCEQGQLCSASQSAKRAQLDGNAMCCTSSLGIRAFSFNKYINGTQQITRFCECMNC